MRKRIGVSVFALMLVGCGEASDTIREASTTTVQPTVALSTIVEPHAHGAAPETTTTFVETITTPAPTTTEPATTVAVAQRIEPVIQVTVTEPPPPVPTGLNGQPFAPSGLDNCDEMNFYRVQWGLPQVFSKLGWRESNCRNEDVVKTWCCHGYWQLHKIHFDGSGYVYGVWCDARSTQDVNSDTPYDKQRQACAAKALLDVSGLGAWAL